MPLISKNKLIISKRVERIHLELEFEIREEQTSRMQVLN